MTAKKPTMSKERSKKLKIKRETLKDLDTRGNARAIKGGRINTQPGAGLMYCSQNNAC